jgi:uncharacterized protein YbcC (UPF0753/DUF2309 family)
MSHKQFDEAHVLDELKHYLPTQTPLKDFIHHNSLHAFQHMKFYDAIFKASKIFGYQVTLQLSEYRELYSIKRIRNEILERIIVEKKGKDKVEEWKKKLLDKDFDVHNSPRIGLLRANWKHHYKIDLDNLVQPLLFRILCSYLDQGISIWPFPAKKEGFLSSISALEKNSFTSFFKTSRARQLLLQGNGKITDLLKIIVGDEAYFEQYLFDQQFSHRGWSGMSATVELVPHSLLDTKIISLHDLIVFELLLEIDALDAEFGTQWKPLTNVVNTKPVNLFEDVENTELHEVLKLWQDAFEWSYYDEVLAGIKQLKTKKNELKVDAYNGVTNLKEVNSKVLPFREPNRAGSDGDLGGAIFQALFCIDERECSIRRHIEHVVTACETFGTPGFFGVEFYMQPQNAKFYDKLCPAPVTPKYLIKEYDVKHKRKHELLYTDKTHGFIYGLISTLTLGFFAAVKLVQTIFRPKMSPAISNAFAHMSKDGKLTIENKSLDDRENNLQIGFTVEEMTARVEGLLRGIGLINDFAPIVYVIAHGSSSANNPHHGAHDCGACSGRPGSVNSRVFAFMANHQKVRESLKIKGIVIPVETQFVGALHDTAADQMEFYDEGVLTKTNAKRHIANIESFEKALDLNAKERSRRFASINTKKSLKHVRNEILKRSVSMFEPRPELGHGTNTLCIIANRNLTKGLFLDRRAFLNSYDYHNDLDGKLLTGIMRPIGPVCGGINLEYYFSRVDNYKLGAGTKLPHNVMGLIGVANSSDGDLRPGLPLQMIEVHDPVRLLVIVEHYPEVVLKVIQSAPEMYEWYLNEWVHILVVHPETNEFFYFKDGEFTAYVPVIKKVNTVNDLIVLVEDATEMETNYIVDATRENLPVYSLK